jgi:hypothetical protein
MTARSLNNTRLYIRPISLPRLFRNINLNIRKDLLVSRIMVAAGLFIPALMVFKIISSSFFLLTFAFALTFVGGVMWLIRCGEVA